MSWKQRLIQGAAVAVVAAVAGTMAAVYSAPHLKQSTTLPWIAVILACAGFFLGAVFKIRL